MRAPATPKTAWSPLVLWKLAYFSVHGASELDCTKASELLALAMFALRPKNANASYITGVLPSARDSGGYVKGICDEDRKAGEESRDARPMWTANHSVYGRDTWRRRLEQGHAGWEHAHAFFRGNGTV